MNNSLCSSSTRRGRSRGPIAWLAASAIVCAATASTPVYASDALMNLLAVLKDKGTLTQAEYDALRDAAAGNGAQLAVAPERTDTAPIPAPSSDWTDTIRMAGDMRLRYQRNEQDGETDRGRGRFRYRLGITAEPAPRLEVGAGLASGSSDPRSTNQTFDDNFSSKPINLDYAYVQYQLNEHVKAISGKFKPGDYLYRSTDLMWDTDINPEGASVNLTGDNRLGTGFVNTGIWVLQENAARSNDPYMFFAQAGEKLRSGDSFATLAATYYSFRDINALADYGSTGSNTDYRFRDIYDVSGEWGVDNLLGRGIKASIVGQLTYNDDTATSKDTGFAVGLKASRDAWSFKYLYADLEANAVPDILPDSDRFDGFTAIDGHEFEVNYALAKNVTLGLDYYDVDNKVGVNQNVLQLDVLVAF